MKDSKREKRQVKVNDEELYSQMASKKEEIKDFGKLPDQNCLDCHQKFNENSEGCSSDSCSSDSSGKVNQKWKDSQSGSSKSSGIKQKQEISKSSSSQSSGIRDKRESSNSDSSERSNEKIKFRKKRSSSGSIGSSKDIKKSMKSSSESVNQHGSSDSSDSGDIAIESNKKNIIYSQNSNHGTKCMKKNMSSGSNSSREKSSDSSKIRSKSNSSNSNQSSSSDSIKITKKPKQKIQQIVNQSKKKYSSNSASSLSPSSVSSSPSSSSSSSKNANLISLNSNEAQENEYLIEDPFQVIQFESINSTDLIQISMKSAYNPIILSQNSSQSVPCMIEFKCPDQDINDRAGIDIICVIDVSGSMSGNKLSLVKKTLLFMIRRLTVTDRVAFITFSSYAKMLTNLICMTDSGKTTLSKTIKKTRSGGGTDIIAGIRKALKLLRNRKIPNQITSIILLSDGLDGSMSTSMARLEKLFIKYNEKIPVGYIIHTFGYGSDHQADLLNMMASKTNGGFYFVENENSIPKIFSDCLGEIMSTVADSVNVELETQPGPINFKLTKVYSETGDLSFKMPPLLAGDSKETVFVLDFFLGEQVTPFEFFPIKAKVKYLLAKSGKVVICEQFLKICFNCEGQVDVDDNVLVQFYRGKCADVMKEAADMADHGLLNEAKEIVVNTIEEFKNCSVAQSEIVAKLINELQNILPRFNSKAVYERGGKAELRSKANKNYSKRCDYKNSVQKRLMNEAKDEFSSS